MSSTMGTLSVKVEALTAEFKKDLAAVTDLVEEHEKGIQALGAAATVAFGVAALSVKSWVTAASDAGEAMNVLRVGFGEMLPEVQVWADAASDAMGRAKVDMLDMAGGLQAMLVPMTENSEASARMSTELAGLAVDLGSFFNATDNDALIALKAGLVGSSEPMRRFGVVMTQATLQLFALEQGIDKSVKQMTEAEKVSLRYQFIMEKTSLAHGDAAATLGGFANKTKQIQGQLKDLAVALGESLLPAAEAVAGWVSAMVGWFNELNPAAKKFIAIGTAVGGALAGIGAGLAGIALLLPTLTAGFATLGTVISTAIWPATLVLLGVSAAIAGIILIIGIMRKVWDENMGGIQEKTEQFIAGQKLLYGFLWDSIIAGLKLVVDGFLLQFKIISAAIEMMSFGKIQIDVPDGDDLFKGLGNALDDLGDKGSGLASEIGTELGDSFKRGLETIGDLMDEVMGVSEPELVPLVAPGGVGGGVGVAPPDIMGGGGGLGGGEDEGFDFGGAGGGSTGTEFETDPLVEVAAAANTKIAEGVAGLVNTIFDGMGEAGQALNNLVGSLASGDLFGAAAGAIGAVISKSKAFAEMGKKLSKLFEKIGKALEPLFRALIPVIDAVIKVIEPFLSLFEILAILEPLLAIVAKILVVVGHVVGAFVRVVASIWNTIIDIVAWVVDIFDEDAADRLRDKRIDLDKKEVAHKKTSTDNNTIAVDNNTESLDIMADTVDEVNEALSNVPDAFKIRAARFGATTAEGLENVGDRANLAGAMVTIVVDNPEDAYERIKDAASEDAFAETGSTVTSSVNPFSVPSEGA